MLPEVDATFVVDEAKMPESDVVDVTPFTFETRFVPDVERPFEFTAVVVLTTPLTFEVITFADEVTVLFVVGVSTVDVATVMRPCASTVITGTSEVLPYVPATTPVLESARVVVPPRETKPPPVRPVPVAIVIEEFTKFEFVTELLGILRFPVTLKFVVVAFVAKRFVKKPESDVIKEEKKLVVVAFVMVAKFPTNPFAVIVPVAVMSPVEVLKE